MPQPSAPATETLGLSPKASSNLLALIYLAQMDYYMEQAKSQGAITIAFTGQGGRLKALANHVLSIPSQDTARIQEAHITAGHIICYLVEEALFGRRPSAVGRGGNGE